MFYESLNFRSILGISLIFENNGILDFFCKTCFQNLKHTFSYATRRALFNHHEKTLKKFSKIFNCGHMIYARKTLKFEYLPLNKSTAANILTLLVWR